MKKMKKLKKLSLENEMKKESEQIEKKVREDKSLDDITVSDEMEKSFSIRFRIMNTTRGIKKSSAKRRKASL